MAEAPPYEVLRLVFDNTSDAIFLLAVEGVDRYRVLSVNARYLESGSVSPEQVIGRPVDELFEGANLQYLYRQYQAAIDLGAPLRYETRTDPGTAEAYIDTTLVPVLDADGRCTHLVGVSRDITQNMSERKALAAEKRRAENYLNIAEALIIALDNNANITMMNRKGYQMVGYPEGSLTGRNWCELFIAPEEREAFWESYRSFLTRREIHSNVNYIRAADGTRILVSWANSIIFDNAGQPAGVLSSGEDITDQRRAEKALIASQRMLAAEEVVSAVAHDFNNSLQGILGNIELAMSSISDPAAREHLEQANRLAGDAASRIRVLQQRRASSDETANIRQQVNLNDLLTDLVAATRHLWHDDAGRQGRRIRVETALARQPVMTEGNPDELRVVFTNIVKNAVEAITGEGTITLSTSTQGGQNIVHIRDTGMGMDAETSLRIFQPFFSTRGLESGRGLGLSASHAIVRNHRGEMQVLETSPGEGTILEVRLPIARQTESAASDVKPADHHILWVDDDQDVLRLAAGYMQILGFEGDTAEGGRQALEKLSQASYSLVITDIGMPGMSGFELAANIRATGNKVPILGLTGWGDQVESDASERLPFHQILGKPIRLAELKSALEEIYP